MSKTRHSFFLVAGRGSGVLFQIVALRYYIEVLGPRGYETIVYGSVLVGYLSLITIGMGTAVQKALAESLHTGDAERYDYELSQGFVWTIANTVLCLAVALLAVRLVPWSAQGQGGLEPVIIAALAGQFCLVQILQLGISVLSAQEKFGAVALLGFLQTAGASLGSIYLLYLYPRPMSVAYGMLAGAGLAAFLSVVLSGMLPATLRGFHCWSRGFSKHLYQVGGRSYFHAASTVIGSTIDRALLGKSAPVGGLATYSVGARLPEVISEVLRPIATTTFPGLARAGLYNDGRFEQSVERDAQIAIAIGGALIVAPCAFSGCILRVWFGAGFLPGSEHVAFLIAGYRALELLLTMLSMPFMAKGEPHRLIPFAAWNALATLIFTLPFLRFFGLTGVAAMNVLISLVQVIPLVGVLRKHLASSLSSRFAWKMLRDFCLVMILAAVIRFTLDTWLALRTPYLGLLLAPIVSVTCFGIMCRTGLCPMTDSLERLLSRARLTIFVPRRCQEPVGRDS